MKLFILIPFILISCRVPDGCAIGETKCINNQVWLCNKSSNWNRIDDCAELSAINGMKLICQPPIMKDPAVCLPADAGN